MRADAPAAAPGSGYLGPRGGRRRAGQDRAVLANTVPFVLLAYGEQHVDSVLAGLLNATTPLMTLLFVPLLVPTSGSPRVGWPGC
jgi:drug/metabolite transporter (DMT)-like permease